MFITYIYTDIYTVVKVTLSPRGLAPLVRIIASSVHMIASSVFILVHCMVVCVS